MPRPDHSGSDHPLDRFPQFVVASGEETSDPLVLRDESEVRIDQLKCSRHLEHMDDDLAAVRSLGIRLWRYGMPWRLAETSPGTYDWRLWDTALASCQQNELIPIVDLCHFGLPDHYQGFCDSRWVEGFIGYVEAFLERYRSPIFFTPVNEPMITAMCSGYLGIWNDRRSSHSDYMNALANLTLANLEALARIDSNRNGWWIGAEGFGCHIAVTDEDRIEADRARSMEQLVWDLHLGVDPPSGVADLVDLVDASVMSRIDELAGTFPSARTVSGHDFYPVSVQVHGERSDPLTIEERVTAYMDEAAKWFRRYKRPFWVAETSNLGLDPTDGKIWLTRLVAALEQMANDGLPVRGICWYSRGDQYDWQTMLTNPTGQITEVGLFDVSRTPRPVAAELSRLAGRHAQWI